MYKRQYERVRLSASAKIYLGDKEIEGLRTKDISLSGIYVIGKLQSYSFEPCRLTIKGTWLDSEPIFLDVTARVSRRDHCGTGFQFTQMNHDDFEILQTYLLYGSPDPMDLGREFARCCPFEVDEYIPQHYGQRPITDLTC
jgi:hypothetical protein